MREVHVDEIIDPIQKLKCWNRSQFASECNSYIYDIVNLFRQIDEQIYSANFPDQIHHKLNSECLLYLQEIIVLKYAKITKVTLFR